MKTLSFTRKPLNAAPRSQKRVTASCSPVKDEPRNAPHGHSVFIYSIAWDTSVRRDVVRRYHWLRGREFVDVDRNGLATLLGAA